MAISSFVATWLAIFAVPVAFYIAWSDAKFMRIPNTVNLVLLGVFVVVGVFVMPSWGQYFSQLLNALLVLLAGMVMVMFRLGLGAGDVKVMTAIAPYVATQGIIGGDFLLALVLFFSCFLSGIFVHIGSRFVKPFRAMAADWKSWQEWRVYPFGFSAATFLIMYLVAGIFWGARV